MIVTIPTPLRPRKVGNSMVVTIPSDICEQLAIDSETLLQITLEPVEQITIPRLDSDVQRALDQVLETDQAALRHLRGH
jgi:antitoxin component of MazEF toxin-antitoxin module